MNGIINPTLENIDKYLDDLMDKNGSDYNSLPVKLDRFIACTYNLLESTEIYLDGTQSLSDDIRPLIIERSDISINKTIEGKWEIPVPLDYLRLITTYPLINGKRFAREVKILKNGQEDYELNPFRKSDHEYINVFRVGDFFKLYTGEGDSNIYNNAYIKYIKHPVFATEFELEKRIVNLSTELIIKICDVVSDSFRYTTGDVSAQVVESFNNKYGKRNRS